MASPRPCQGPPARGPLRRNSLRTGLAATLSIAILVWSGRAGVMLLGLSTAVAFINDDDLTPLHAPLPALQRDRLQTPEAVLAYERLPPRSCSSWRAAWRC